VNTYQLFLCILIFTENKPGYAAQPEPQHVTSKYPWNRSQIYRKILKFTRICFLLYLLLLKHNSKYQIHICAVKV